jgi:hypothetical protein
MTQKNEARSPTKGTGQATHERVKPAFYRNDIKNASGIDTLLSRLDGVRLTGAGRWIARCPALDEHIRSLAIRLTDDGRILLHDFGGCDVHEIVSSLGMNLSDLFPERAPGDHVRHPERRPFFAADVLRCLTSEVMIAAATCAAMLDGRPLISIDRERLMLSASRFQSALAMAEARHGR